MATPSILVLPRRVNNSWPAGLTKPEVSTNLLTPLSPSLFPHQLLYRASLTLKYITNSNWPPFWIKKTMFIQFQNYLEPENIDIDTNIKFLSPLFDKIWDIENSWPPFWKWLPQPPQTNIFATFGILDSDNIDIETIINFLSILFAEIWDIGNSWRPFWKWLPLSPQDQYIYQIWILGPWQQRQTHTNKLPIYIIRRDIWHWKFMAAILKMAAAAPTDQYICHIWNPWLWQHWHQGSHRPSKTHENPRITKPILEGTLKPSNFTQNPPKLSNWMCGFFVLVVNVLWCACTINGCLCVTVSDIEMINIHQKPTHWALDCTGNPYHIITTTAAQPSSVTAPVIGHCSCLYAVSESATTYQLLGLVLVMA